MYISIPQYESLSIKEIKKFVEENKSCKEYLPVDQEWDKLPKVWISTILYTTLKDKFSTWVKNRIQERNAGIVKQKNLAIKMDPEVMKAFFNSSAVSSKLIHCLYLGPYLTLAFIRTYSTKGNWCQHAQGRFQEEKDYGADQGAEGRGGNPKAGD